MIKTPAPTNPPVHPDIVYLLYQPPETSEKDAHRKLSKDFVYKRYLQHSAASYINAHMRQYLLDIKRPRGFDYTASCGTNYWGGEIEQLPDIHVYSSIDLNTTGKKVYVHDLQPIIDLCPVNVFKENGLYIPGLKAAAVLYHSVHSDKSRNFILSDVDIIYYNVRSGIDPKAIYMCGVEFNPLLSFLNFSGGIEVFSHLGKKKQADVEEYQKYSKWLKIPMESQLFNNGIIHIPHIHTKDFFDMYYRYLIDLTESGQEMLQWPWPFWTAEMFATNYVIAHLSVYENTVLRRFDPDAVDLVHDIHSQYQIFIDEILQL